ncbi:MAG: MFS transporter, partial [Pseudomonadota bacterium]
IASQGWIVYAAGPFAALAGFYGPALTNMMSIRVSENEQGELQGALGAAQGLALMIGPVLLGWVFYIFADAEAAPIYLPDAPFLVASCFALICVVLFWFSADRTNASNDTDAVEDGPSKT